MRRAAFAFALCLLCSLRAAADPPPLDDAFLDQLAGSWVLRCTIAAQEATHDVRGEWVAGHQYLQLVEQSRERAPDGRLAYEAVVLLGRDTPSGEYQCLWIDSTAGGALAEQSIGHGTLSGAAIRFAWKTGGTLDFTNTFSYDAHAEAWSWQMDNIVDGKPVAFGRMRLTRR